MPTDWADIEKLRARLGVYSAAYFDLEWEYQMAIKALIGAKAAIQGLAEQQAMPDDFYVADLARVVIALESNKSYRRSNGIQMEDQDEGN